MTSRHRAHSLPLVIFVIAASVLQLSGCATQDFSDASFSRYRTAVYVAAAGDAISTHVALENCPSCIEGNPIMKPIVDQGFAATLAVKAAYGYLLMRQADKMREAGNPYWKVLPQFAFILNGGLLTWNLSLAR